MGSKTEEIVYKPKAIKSIKEISKYIAEKGYPETAEKYSDRLFTFGESLLAFHEKYPFCRFPKLSKRNLRCAIFEQHYVFIYKKVRTELIIYNVVHSKTLK